MAHHPDENKKPHQNRDALYGGVFVLAIVISIIAAVFMLMPGPTDEEGTDAGSRDLEREAEQSEVKTVSPYELHLKDLADAEWDPRDDIKLHLKERADAPELHTEEDVMLENVKEFQTLTITTLDQCNAVTSYGDYLALAEMMQTPDDLGFTVFYWLKVGLGVGERIAAEYGDIPEIGNEIGRLLELHTRLNDCIRDKLDKYGG